MKPLEALNNNKKPKHRAERATYDPVSKSIGTEVLE